MMEQEWLVKPDLICNHAVGLFLLPDRNYWIKIGLLPHILQSLYSVINCIQKNTSS